MNHVSGSVASVRFRAGIGGEPVVAEAQASATHAFEAARWGATMVSSPESPVAGDHSALKVVVGVGCCAEVRGSAPTVARRGAARGEGHDGFGSPGSSLGITATVASDGMLTWRPEPGVATDACHHRCDANVEMAGSARLLWRDEFVTERVAETAPGTWSSRIRIVRDGWPVFCTELAVGPGSPLWESPAVLEGARAVSVLVVVDPGLAADEWKTARRADAAATAVALPLAGPGIQIVAWGDDLFDCRVAIEGLVAPAGIPGWAAERWRHGRTLDAVG